MPRLSTVGFAIASVTAVLATTSPASAANGLRPRTPAVFAETACIQRVDKQTDPMMHIEYTVAYDDTMFTPEELPDTRTHQFFALGQQVFDYAPPVYINQSDFDRAEANGDNTVEYTADDILETSTTWPAGSWLRITGDDARVPITMAQAEQGVDWDLTDVPPGPWMISAYTWEPEQNLWSFHGGLVQVIDSMDPGAEGPAVYVATEAGLFADVGTEVMVRACVDAPDGATLSLSYGVLAGVDAPTWVSVVDDMAVQSGELDLPVVVPPEASGALLKFRAEIDDGQGGTYVAFTPVVVTVPESGMTSTTTGGDTVGDDDGPSDDDTAGEDDLGDVSCRTGGRAGLVAPLLLFLLGLARRRR